MDRKFTCLYCKRRVKADARQKGPQRYCGLVPCQQARKNAWERTRIRDDPSYREKRKKTKAIWRLNRPGYSYQRAYRLSHPGYTENNREKQAVRNKKRNASVSCRKIVKTDALNPVSLVKSGLYALYPFEITESKKIVKTDALIVQLMDIEHNAEVLMNKSP